VITLQIDIDEVEAKSKFEKKIDKIDGCWIWNGSIHKKSNKYGKDYKGKWDCGMFYMGRIHMVAYRAAYILYKGIIDINAIVRHTCDNSLCVNPDHLILGTNKQNTSDSVERGRNVHGIKVWTSKLNEEKVKTILDRISSGDTLTKIAQDYGMSIGAISLIKNGHNWKKVVQEYYQT
jgi:hypothetical protein